MQNIPKTIYLQIGEDCSTDDGEDFNTLYGVSWCSERINENDIEYELAPIIVAEDWRKKLFDYMKESHDINLLESDMEDIKSCIISRKFPQII